MQEVAKDMYKIDNFLPTRFHNSIRDLVFSNEFPWFFLEDSTNFEKNLLNNFSFSNVIYNNDTKYNYVDFFLPMIYFIPVEIAQDISILRIRAGMQTKVDSFETINNSPHVDQAVNHKTLLYYVNDSDGDTLFYSDEKGSEVIFKNTPKENSAIIFDGKIYHSSSHPTKVQARVTININYQDI